MRTGTGSVGSGEEPTELGQGKMTWEETKELKRYARNLWQTGNFR